MNPLLDLSARPVIAHRGASASAPENTLPAFELAAQQGADAFELDVRLTRDGAPVVIHDATLERTTSLTGPVRARTLAELRAADAGHWYTPDGGRTMPCRDHGVRIPTLAEVLWAFPAMPVLIEVKEPEVQEAVRRVLVDEQRVGALRGGVGGRRGAHCCSATARFPAARRRERSPSSTGRCCSGAGSRSRGTGS